MAGCSQILNGLAAQCVFSVGGIKKIYAINRTDVTSYTQADGKITAVVLKDDAKFKAYNFKRGTGSLSTEATIDEANGTHFYTSTLTLSFAKQDTEKRLALQAMALAEMAIIVLDANDNYFYLGQDEPVVASAHSAQTGTARTDGNNYGLTLTDISKEMPYFVDATIIPDITAEVVGA